MTDWTAIAQTTKAWPFEEARKVLKRIGGKTPKKGYVLFQTGYGPSGLPHIGTFGEVARTAMVMHAFRTLTNGDIPTKLLAFSDDMDGMRKVPDNIPNQDLLQTNLNKSLTSVPDPFGTHASFAHHNNAKLCEFLDSFGFEYEFASSTEYYQSGRFNDTLHRFLEVYEDIQNIMLPTLGEERRKVYSPFLPVDPETKEVLQVPVIATDAQAGTITYEKPDGTQVTTTVTDGNVKMQWKPDWAMRWFALDVDYEMCGKDLAESVTISSRITKALGGTPPQNLIYELFLDEQGGKISKSKGNGLSIEQWLTYAPHESLALYMFLKPRTAKRLFFDAIPKMVDDYVNHVKQWDDQLQNNPEKLLENPVWHIHKGEKPIVDVPVSFGLLLNLAGACNARDKATMWGFISRYADGVTPKNNPFLDRMAGFAVQYYQDFIHPQKKYRLPNKREQKGLEMLLEKLDNFTNSSESEDIQTEIYSIGKALKYENLRDWFAGIYETLLGQSQGPRMGTFIKLYGVEETKAIIRDVLDGKNLNL